MALAPGVERAGASLLLENLFAKKILGYDEECLPEPGDGLYFL